MPGKRGDARAVGVWPGLVVPIALTSLLAAAAFLFVAKVSADQERAKAESLDLARTAQSEAGRLAARARDVVRDFVDGRTAARSTQEGNLRLEARSVLNSVYQLLGVGLEKAGKSSVARREVGPLPHGFDGMRPFLEIPPPGERRDAPLAALRAMAPELTELLPAGCSLAVIEDNSRELLSLGGPPSEGAVSVSLVRDFLFNDAGGGRHWSLRLDVSGPDAHPPAAAPEIAAHLASGLAGFSPPGIVWRGWLLGPGDGVAASFSAAGDDPSLPPFVGKAGEWVVVDDQRLVWMDRASVLPGVEWTPAIAVAIPRPAPPLIIADEFWRDRQWCATLLGLGALSLGGWVWFVRSLSRARNASDSSRREEGAAGRPRQKLVRDSSSRTIPEVQGVIVADIDDDGTVRLETPRPRPGRPAAMPSGSLARLQAIHRGREAAPGSRILDLARSPVLRELASRVRPPARNEAQAAAAAKAAEKIAAMKSVTGWRKVDE